MAEYLKFRLLDLAPQGPGQFSAQVLGDLGFDVVRITGVAASKGGRAGHMPTIQMPLHEPTPGMKSVAVGSRNARQVGINLKDPKGLEIFDRLVATADAMQEGFRPGTADRLGVGYGRVKELNPDIVYASLTGYGQTGPYSQRSGHDLNYLAVAGFIDGNGSEGAPPAIPAAVLADFAAGGMSATIHILAGLLRRQMTGEGSYCDVAMADAVVEINSLPLGMYLSSGVEPRRGETFTSGLWHWYGVYECADGKYISVAAIEPWFYESFCECIERPEMTGRQWDAEGRVALKAQVATAFRERSREEWVERSTTFDACMAPVLSPAEAVNDPQLVARGLVREYDHPLHGTVRALGTMLKLPVVSGDARTWAGAPGEHTGAVLSEVGYGAAEIRELRARGVVD